MILKRSTIKQLAATMLSVSVATAGTVAVASETQNPVPAVQPANEARFYFNAQSLIEAFENLDTNASAEEMASQLFPHDKEAQHEVAEALRKIDEQEQQSNSTRRKRAVPAALLPFLAPLGRCVIGALSGVAVAEILHLAFTGQQNAAESRIEALVGGCITSTVPPLLRPLAAKAKKPLAAAILAIVIRWKS